MEGSCCEIKAIAILAICNGGCCPEKKMVVIQVELKEIVPLALVIGPVLKQ